MKKECDDFKDVKSLGLAIMKMRENFKCDYFLNEENYAKFNKIVRYFQNYIEENGGEITILSCDPKDIHGGIVLRTEYVDVYGDALKEFANIILLSDVFAISTADEDEILIEASVNYIWNAVDRK